MKDKFSKFINLQGKYLTSLLILLALSIGQMWAAEIFSTDVLASVSSATVSQDKGAYTAGTATSWSGSYENYFATSGSAGYYQLAFSTPISLSSYTDVKIKVYWGTTSNRPLNLTINGGSATKIDEVTASSDRSKLRAAEANISETSISSLKLSSSGGGGVHLFRIEITGTASGGGSDPVDPVFTYTPATYTIGDPALDLSTKLISTNTTGAITFAVSTSDDGTTGASIASSKNFTATTAGTAKVTVSQAASTGYNAKSQDIDVTVVEPDPCTTYFHFVATADATTNGKTNWDGFTNAPTGSNNQSNSVTIDGTTYTLTKRTGSTGGGGTILGFTIPANKAGTLYGYMKSSGSAARILSLKKGDDVIKTNTEIVDGAWTLITIDAIAPGTYTLSPDQNVQVQMFVLKICDATFRTITLEYADGETADGSLSALDGAPATKPTDPTWEHHRFDGWYNGATPYDWTANVTGDITLTAHWTQLYTISFNNGGGSGDAPAAIADKAQSETFEVPANTFTAPAGQVFDYWNDGTNDYNPGDTYTVGTSNVTLTAVWRTPSTMYAITKGAHENGDFTIDPASQEAGEVVTLEATPDDGYLFGAWEVVKTEDASATGITVDANGQFTMPGYAVTVNATFAADPRKKILYVTNNDEATTKANDKLYEALKDDYRVTIVGPTSDADQTNYDLVVLHESIGGGNYGATAVAAAKTGNTPVLNTKSYFYNDGRWGWGAPNAGQSVKGATLNSSYCNIADHPLFDGVTMTAGFFEITDDAAAKCMQPVGSFTSGKEGYTLATTPNNGEGNGCAIHELTPAQRGASAGKYLMISVSGDKLNALNANGQKLFQNAAAYLIGSTAWEPIAVPTAAVIEAAPSAAYSVGDDIALSALAAGVSAATTYTWYKGDTWAEAETAGAIQAAKTAAESGDSFGITGCALGDEGTYWCVISNGTDCEAKASLVVTVTDASYNITFVSAHGTAPTASTGVSYTLPTLTESGWAHQGWTASIDVEVDAATVNAGDLIANGKMAVFAADVEFTAVWKQEFQVTFNLKGHGDPIAAQIVVDGELATEPDAPFEIGYDFGGWFTDEECTAGNEFDFDTPITAATPLFAKWTAFDGCTLLYPATSGAALNVGDNIDVQSGSKGGSIQVVGMKQAGSIAYDGRGLLMGGGSADIISVTLANDMDIDTKITVTLDAKAGGRPRGLYLLTGTGANVKGGTLLGWPDDGSGNVPEGEIESFSYTVEASDGLEGTNVFRLKRQNSTYIKCIKVESCGAAVVFHNLTSAVDPADKGTVTLGATSVREGYTTTAEYSAIDPLYEFVSWSVSGEGASIADASANPATITMGTADAVVTLNLQLIPEKFTVNYFDDETPMGTEQVELNAHPTAAGIATAKRHYTFEGWAETKGGSVVDLNSITSDVVATINLYAKYAPVDCPTTGYLFSMEFDETKKPAETVVVAKNGGKVELADYATISGGNAFIQNDETSNKDAISTDGKFLLKATKEVMKIELDCALQLGDIIRIPDNNQKYVISTSNAKTGTYQQQTSSQHEFAVTSDWVGVDDIFILYDGSSLNFTQVYVYRPAKFDVSFNMMGHGTQIADIEDVIDGSKISAPTAPTNEDYAFCGWYKESTLENEWDFDNDVVTAATTLYAKWLDKSDATLKSLKYGDTEIALEDGVYTYEVNVPGFLTAVPALTAVTSNPSAIAAVTDAAVFDGEGKATSTVEVTPEKEGAAHQTYTVKFTKLPLYTDIVDVTGYTEWSWAGVASAEVKINDVANRGVILANYIDAPNFEMLAGQENARAYRSNTYPAYQGTYLKFHATVPGRLTIKARNSSGSPILRVNGIDLATLNGTPTDYITAVPEGDVEITSSADEFRIYAMTFDPAVDYTRDVTEGKYGTICLPTNGVMIGASIYTLAYFGGTSQKIFFDEVVAGRMEAGKPYLFLPDEGVNKIKVFYTDSENEAAKTVNGFVGYIGASEDQADALQVPDGEGCYIIQNNQYREILDGAEAYILSHRAYIKKSEISTTEPAKAPGVRRIGISGAPQVTTDVESINAFEQPVKVMIDGTIYILRGEKVYNVNGQIVK